MHCKHGCSDVHTYRVGKRLEVLAMKKLDHNMKKLDLNMKKLDHNTFSMSATSFNIECNFLQHRVHAPEVNPAQWQQQSHSSELDDDLVRSESSDPV